MGRLGQISLALDKVSLISSIFFTVVENFVYEDVIQG